MEGVMKGKVESISDIIAETKRIIDKPLDEITNKEREYLRKAAKLMNSLWGDGDKIASD